MITVYTKNNCKYCEQTKQYLDHLKIKYEIVNIDLTSKAKEFMLSEHHKTVPQIYKNGKLFIEGGYSGLMVSDPDILKD